MSDTCFTYEYPIEEYVNTVASITTSYGNVLWVGNAANDKFIIFYNIDDEYGKNEFAIYYVANETYQELASELRSCVFLKY